MAGPLLSNESVLHRISDELARSGGVVRLRAQGRPAADGRLVAAAASGRARPGAVGGIGAGGGLRARRRRGHWRRRTLDLSSEFPKPPTGETVRAADVVITMRGGDACPVYPGKRYLDWDLPDPGGELLPTVWAIRDEIDRRVAALVGEVLVARVGG